MPENGILETEDPLSVKAHVPSTPQNFSGFSASELYKTLNPRNYTLADYAYEVILERVKEFEKQLDDDHEAAIKLASFGQAVTMSVTGIGYSNPSTLVFYGFVGDQPATLIQHMSQLNFLLLAVKKADPQKPPRRIGFVAPRED